MHLSMAGMELLQNDLTYTVLQSNPKQNPKHPSLGTSMCKNSVIYHISFRSQNDEDLTSIHPSLIFQSQTQLKLSYQK